MTAPDLDAYARALMDANLYMTLATVDSAGMPWATPVYYAIADYTELFWVSKADARHSCNIAAQPAVSMVIFDSTVPTYHGRAVYLSGTATELAGRDLDRGIGIYPGDPGRGASTVSIEDVIAPSEYRLYSATITEAYVLCPGEPRHPCSAHGIATEHRAPVVPWRHPA